MKQYNNKLIIILTFLLIIVPSWAFSMESIGLDDIFEFMDEITEDDILAENYYVIIDEEGNTLLETGRKIFVDDEYLTGNNLLFRVYKVEDRKAYAKFVEEINLKEYLPENFREELLSSSWLSASAISLVQAEEDEGEVEDIVEPSRLVAIYHTHNAESYVPTDGTDSIYGKGGIHEVGRAFKETLEERGINVIHDETLHLPHDRGAYRRSRITAQRLLSEGPDVIFDVHRDAAPMNAYATQVDGDWVTQVQFVVGRQNQNFSINRNFAFDLKGQADELQPDLIKGVFFAHGNYNQDITPLNLLLEVGAHQNTREAAEDGISVFADIVEYYFYGPPDEEIEEEGAPAPISDGAPPAQGGGLGLRSALQVVFGMIFFVGIGALGMFWINAGNTEEFKKIGMLWISRVGEEVSHRIDFIKDKWNEIINKQRLK